VAAPSAGLFQRGAEQTVREIRRATPKHYSAEDKIRVVLAGLRDETSIASTAVPKGEIDR